MIRRTWIVPAFLALLAVGMLVGGLAQPSTLKQIVPGVWFREGDLKHDGYCNNIVIEMKDYLVVIDANFPGGARTVLADAKKVSSKPVKYVFDTHHHGDHAYGNPVWTKLGAVTLAYAGVAEEMKRYEPKAWQSTARNRKDVAELKLATAEPPQQTFAESPYVLDDGARRLEFHFFGWAHTRGDGFAWLPKEKVLCTGDAVVNGPYNYTGHGNVRNWNNVIRTAQKLEAEHVLPGHGGPGGKEVLAGQIRFFTELQRAVELAIKEGKKLDDPAAARSLRLPDSVKHWVGDFLAGQVWDTYRELTENRPIGELTGGK